MLNVSPNTVFVKTSLTGYDTTMGARQRVRGTRERFLEAALAVFRERGYRDTTVQDILTEAGGGRATFYAHFSGKSDVAAQLFEACLPGAQAHYAELASAPSLTYAYVRERMVKSLGFWSANRVIMEALNAAMTDDPAVAERHYQWNVEAVEALTRDWEDSRRAEGRLRAILLVLQWERFCYHWLIQGVPQDRELVLDVIADLWYRELTTLRTAP